MQYINSLYFKNDDLNRLTRSLDFLGNAFLTPARYMLGGRSGTCFLIMDDRQGNVYIAKDFYGNIQEKKSN